MNSPAVQSSSSSFQYQEQLAQLSAIFESHPQPLLRTVLEAHSGNIERSVEYLFSQDDLAEPPTSPYYNTPDQSRLAASLMNTTLPSRATASPITALRGGIQQYASESLDLDEEMARRLQEELNLEAEREHRIYLEQRRQMNQQRQQQQLYTQQRNEQPNISKEQMKIIVENIKEMILPAIQDQMKGVVIPDIQSDSPKLMFLLSNITLPSFVLPIESVNVVIIDNEDKDSSDSAPQNQGVDTDSPRDASASSVCANPQEQKINIDVADIQLELNIGTWKYEKKSIPKWKDSGSATASLKNVNLDIVLSIPTGASASDIIRVSHCSVHIGDIKLKTAVTKAAWIYNALALMFKPALRSAAQTGLQANIKQVIEDQVNDWHSWASER